METKSIISRLGESSKAKLSLITCSGCAGLFTLCTITLFIIGINNPTPSSQVNNVTVSSTATPETTTSTSPILTITSTPTPVPKQEIIFNVNNLIGLNIDEVSKKFGVAPNQIGSIKYENEDYLLQVDSNKDKSLYYMSVQLKKMKGCKGNEEVVKSVDEAFRLTGLDPSKKGEPTSREASLKIGNVEYGNYPGNIKPGLLCLHEDLPYTVTITIKK